MARAKRKGDEYYNARRRYQRAAERNMRKAEQSSGATAARYRNLAKQDLQKALATYDKGTTQNFSKPMQKLANNLGVDLGEKRARMKGLKDKVAKDLQTKAVEKSTERLAGAMETTEQLRQAEARAVFSSEVGHRIIGGLVDVWRDKAVKGGKIDKEKMMKAIYDYFQVDNLADVLQKVEQSLGEILYQDADTDTIYETVKLTIQNKVADNTLVA